MMRRAALAAGLCLLSSGCATWPAYYRSRAADAADVVPVSIAWGWGIGASIQATSCFHLGLALSPIVSDRWGYADRTFHGVWHEYELDFPWTPFLEQLGPVPPRPFGANDDRPNGDGVTIVYRWQIMKDAPSGEGYDASHWETNVQQWGRHHPVARETGGAFVVPEYRRALNWHDLRLEQGDEEPLNKLGTPERATLWRATRDGPDLPRAWDLFEIDVFAGILGARVGVRPVEFFDFLVGWVGFDPSGDDLHDPTFEEPRPLPPLPERARPSDSDKPPGVPESPSAPAPSPTVPDVTPPPAEPPAATPPAPTPPPEPPATPKQG